MNENLGLSASTNQPLAEEPFWLTNDRQVQKLGYLLVGFLILVVGGWSAFAPLESAALAPGIVQVTGKRQPVQHLEGGIVAEILVSSGDGVTEGQPLVRLDATRDSAEMQIAQGRIYNARAAVDRLLCESTDLNTVEFSSPLLLAAKSDDRASAAISREKSLFEVRLADRKGEVTVLQTKKTGMRAVVTAKKQVLTSLEQEIADLSLLLADGYVDKQRLRELERNRAQLVGQIADLDVSIQEVALKILQLQKRFKTDVVDELSVTQEELYDLERTYEAVSDRVDRATIRAPVTGEVIDLQLNAVGAVVGSGETLMELLPESDSLFIEARVSPMDIDRVRIGQNAEVRFAVFKDAYLVSGVLTKISRTASLTLQAMLHITKLK